MKWLKQLFCVHQWFGGALEVEVLDQCAACGKKNPYIPWSLGSC